MISRTSQHRDRRSWILRIGAVTALCLPALVGCTSNGLSDSDASDGATDDLAAEESPSPEDADEGILYYLEAGPGCYSLTQNAGQNALIEAIGKEVFPQDCADPHAFEVFWSGDVPGFDAKNNLSQEDAGDVCIAEYQSIFAVDPPSEIIPQEDQLSSPYLYWFFPDDGLEAQKYPGRLVCGVFLGDDEYTRMLSHRGSIVPSGI